MWCSLPLSPPYGFFSWCAANKGRGGDEDFQQLGGTLTARRILLEDAADLVDGDRNSTYGDPVQDFKRTAAYWNTHIGGVLRRELSVRGYPDKTITTDMVLSIVDALLDPHDVAIMMTQLKHSRLAWSPEHHDNWVDAAGYAACGWDCVERGN